MYGLLYNYMYAPNVVRNAPVAVVDMSRTPLSRSYIRLLDATPQARVLTNNADLPAAKELMKCDEVVGIVYIPSDFDARVGRGEEAIYIMYSTTTAFLYFASMQEASAGAMLAVNDDVRPEQVVFYLRMIYSLWFKQSLSMWWVPPCIIIPMVMVLI